MLPGIVSLSSLNLLVLLCFNKSSLASIFDEHKGENHRLIQARADSANQVIKTCKNPESFAMTFDDGPYIYQSNVSNFLTSRGIHGTFFVNGYNWDCIYEEKMVNQLKRTFAQGHLIGSHTWSHPDITTLTAAELNLQLDLVETALRKILGIIPRYFRAPYGNINDENLSILTKRGYQVINWSFDSGDSVGVSAIQSKKSYDDLAKQFPTPQIALNHETYAPTAFDVTPYAVNVLQKAGYQLVSVSECLGSGSSPDAYYQFVGKPEKRDSSWTCDGTPRPGA